jgi:hypothetical protein
LPDTGAAGVRGAATQRKEAITIGELIHGNFGAHDPLLTKRQLSQHPEIRRSTRWVEQQVAKGMPSQLDGVRRMFRLSEVRAWLVEHGFKAGGGGAASKAEVETKDEPDPGVGGNEGEEDDPPAPAVA